MRDTTGFRRAGGALALLAALLCLAQPAAAQTGAYALFEDGNRLFRDDLYWAALLRYRQAGEAGMDTPLLHFNTGVAHYKAQQHIRARESLLLAAEAPQLRVISHYNLGLNAWAAGNEEEALDWLRQARDQQENQRVREYAIVAIARIMEGRRQTDPMLVREEHRREEQRPIADFELSAHVGVGSDDNIFRAPSDPYIDYSDPTLPVVTPVVYSGTYMPVDFRASYAINSLPLENFFGAYRMSARVYNGETENNGDEYSHELRFGSEFERREESRLSQVYSAFTIAQHDEVYYDPDTGEPRFTPDGDIQDRMDYVRYGPELLVRQGFGDFSFGVRLKGQLWDYTDTVAVPEYDHEYFVLGANVQYKILPSTLLRFTAEKSSRRYTSRPSYDLDGNQLVTNPPLRYDYLDYGLVARQRITRDLWFGFGYSLMDRQDRYLGYNDYSRDGYTFEFHWSPGDRFDLEINSLYRNYDYPNAFAFNEPTAGPKTLETLDSELHATWRINRHFTVVGEIFYRDTASTDIRIQYERMMFSVGVKWQM